MRFLNLLALSLLLSATLGPLAGCGTIQYIRELPPAELLEPCLAPTYDKSTNLGLAKGLVAYHGALSLCNDDKEALRKWATDHGTTQPAGNTP